MALPLVSICIPTYNNSEFILETLQSVLSQSYSNLEVVVVDDCSTDDTAQKVLTVDDGRLKFQQNEKNLGMHGNWQKALELGTGEYLKLVCGDDLLHRDCVAKQLEVLSDPDNSDLAMVACKRSIIKADGTRSGGAFYKLPAGRYTGRTALRMCAIFGTNLIGEPMTVMFRGDVFRKEKIRTGSNNYLIDLDLYSKLLAHGKMLMMRENLASFRIHGESMTGVLGLSKRSAMFREFMAEARLKEDFGINGLYRSVAAFSEFFISRMRALVLLLGKKSKT